MFTLFPSSAYYSPSPFFEMEDPFSTYYLRQSRRRPYRKYTSPPLSFRPLQPCRQVVYLDEPYYHEPQLVVNDSNDDYYNQYFGSHPRFLSQNRSHSKRQVPKNTPKKHRQHAHHQRLLNHLKQVIAATKIQTLVRKHLQRKRDLAALTIQHAWKSYRDRQHGQSLLKPLRIIKDVHRKVDFIGTKYIKVWSTPLHFDQDGNLVRGLENKLFLGFEDELIRVLCEIDSISSAGDTTIRERRRDLVKRVEGILATLDTYKEEERKRHVAMVVDSFEEDDLMSSEEDDICSCDEPTSEEDSLGEWSNFYDDELMRIF